MVHFFKLYLYHVTLITQEKIFEIKNHGTTSVQISPNDSLGQVFRKEHPGWVWGVGDRVFPSQIFGHSNPRYGGIPTSTSCVQELKIEVQELINQIETKDGNMKTMATLLAQLLRHSSMTVPAELLDVIVSFSYHIPWLAIKINIFVEIINYSFTFIVATTTKF